MKEDLTLPLKEIESIEINIPEKIFKINEKNFGKGCTGFVIECEASEGWRITLDTEDGIYSNTFNTRGK